MCILLISVKDPNFYYSHFGGGGGGLMGMTSGMTEIRIIICHTLVNYLMLKVLSNV